MSVQTSRLANGLRVVSDPVDHVETASIGLWVDVGARCESEETNGMSHLLEHMAFKGTERRSARDIAEEIEAVGGHLNAYTSRETTAYYAKVMKEDVPLALDLLADILQHSTFDPEELERERAVVIQEIAQVNDTPDDLVFDRFQETAYPDQPLGRSILGPPERVGSYSRDALAAYMAAQYRAARMVLAGSGRIDHDGLVAAAEEAFTALPEGPTAAPAAAVYGGGDCRVPRDLEQAHVVVGFDGLAYDDDDLYALQVLSTLLGGGMSSRLFQEIRGAARAGLFGLHLLLELRRWRHLRRLRRRRGGSARRADPGDGGRADGRVRHGEREGGRARPRPAQGRPPDVAGEHPGTGGAAGPPHPAVRPAAPDRGDDRTRRCHRPRGGAPHRKPHPGRVPADGHGARADRHAGKP